ncbi:MAG: alpha/beta hydrolase [Pseudomonadota bacterium]
MREHFDVAITGRGPPILFLHGWPFHRATFRHIVAFLEQDFTCFNFNALGMAHDGWIPDGAGMDFADHARRVIAFADAFELPAFHIVAHDTGGTVARLVAAHRPDRVEKLVLLNTEIPGHRPPFIPAYQRLFGHRWAHRWNGAVFRGLARSRFYRRSALGYGGCFHDKALIEGDFKALFVDHFIDHPQRFEGMRRYLVGLDFSVIDRLGEVHGAVRCPVQFIWGANDVTFPMALGREMAASMPTCAGFAAVEASCFLPHEERAATVARHAARFLA